MRSLKEMCSEDAGLSNAIVKISFRMRFFGSIDIKDGRLYEISDAKRGTISNISMLYQCFFDPACIP